MSLSQSFSPGGVFRKGSSVTIGAWWWRRYHALRVSSVVKRKLIGPAWRRGIGRFLDDSFVAQAWKLGTPGFNSDAVVSSCFRWLPTATVINRGKGRR